MLNQVMLIGRLVDIQVMKTTKGGVKVDVYKRQIYILMNLIKKWKEEEIDL